MELFQTVETWAKDNNFELLREDRGAKEYVATRKTPKDMFEDRYAFTMLDGIFYENKRIAKSGKYARHELKHVEQGRRWGFLIFEVLYALDVFVFGYNHSVFEKEARKAENARRNHGKKN
jgi:hypothetical protein